MEQLKHITLHKEKAMANIALNRPEVHNALNIEMIRELNQSIQDLSEDRKTRIIIIRPKR